MNLVTIMETPANNTRPKRKRTTTTSRANPLLATPTKVLAKLRTKSGKNTVAKAKWLRALCNCVISAADGVDGAEDSASIGLLEELLRQDCVDPNCDEDKILAMLGGTPLHIACKLDAPQATRTLLAAGASMVTPWEGITPIELALQQKGGKCAAVLFEQIAYLERQAGEAPEGAEEEKEGGR